MAEYHWHCTKCGYTEGTHPADDPRAVLACPFWSTLRTLIYSKNWSSLATEEAFLKAIAVMDENMAKVRAQTIEECARLILRNGVLRRGVRELAEDIRALGDLP